MLQIAPPATHMLSSAGATLCSPRYTSARDGPDLLVCSRSASLPMEGTSERRALTVEFAYDIACPYAYLGSKKIEAAAARCGARITWTPVLLGGLYDGAKAPQGKAGSATDVMPRAKRAMLSQDLRLQAAHAGAPLVWNSKHPVRTVAALRLLVAAGDAHRPALTHALYKAYWEDDLDVSDARLLRRLAAGAGAPWPDLDDPAVKRRLHENTARFVALGAFGVPCFVVHERLFWGQDRLHFVEKALGRPAAGPSRLLRAPAPGSVPHTLEFFFDFGSPWSYLASLQVSKVAERSGAKLVHKPFLLGALFRAIGTASEPAKVLSPAKAKYLRMDCQDWSAHHNARMRWPSVFPIRSVDALRVAIADPSTQPLLMRAAWERDEEIGRPDVLQRVLEQAGYDGEALLGKAQLEATRDQLRHNTAEAIDLGACGAPTFRVLDAAGRQVALVWGQDRLNVVHDLLCGWRPRGAQQLPGQEGHDGKPPSKSTTGHLHLSSL